MFRKTSSAFVLALLVLSGASTLVRSAEAEEGEKTTETKVDANYAEELMDAAKKAEYNLTLEDIDLAESASTDEEIAEALPLPVAEKLIGHRRRNDMDILREQMIGMIFTGKPRPLGVMRKPPPPPNRRRFFRAKPKGSPFDSEPIFHGIDESSEPKEILKPMPFVPRAPNVEFPVPPMAPSAPHPRRPSASFPVGTRITPHPDFRPGPPRPIFPPDNRPGSFSKFYSDTHGSNRPPKDVFSNNVGPDFGPVTFEEFGVDSHFGNFDNAHSINDFHKPALKPSKPIPAAGFSNTKFGGFDELPKFDQDAHKFGVKLPKFVNEIPEFGRFPQKPVNSLSFNDGFSNDGGCFKYTEDICLDIDNYPHEEILSSLNSDPSRADTLMAEVREQSADDLVDGVSAAEESRYNYAHYFGNRRQGTVSTSPARDFAQEGGYLCPSEVKYAMPKKARNSKGDWKFIVNMNKYTQTIRMEKCMKPGGTCSYVSHHYRATCNQIYNYQRLLSWEKKRGLHMDIFKVPSCCSCHIQGYAYVFPPLNRDDKFSSSDRVDTIIRDDDMELLNKAAPPYSPVNYPNLRVSEVEQENERITGRSGSRSPGSKDGTPRRPSDPSLRPRYRPRPTPVRRSNEQETTRVNYGYHPIIDFFDNERYQ